MRYHELIRETIFTLSKQSQANNEELVTVNTTNIDNEWKKDPDFYIQAGGSNGIRNRYKAFGEWLKDAESMEASEIEVNNQGNISFNNGRHRFAYLRDQGKTIKVAMSKDSIINAKKYGYLA